MRTDGNCSFFIMTIMPLGLYGIIDFYIFLSRNHESSKLFTLIESIWVIRHLLPSIEVPLACYLLLHVLNFYIIFCFVFLYLLLLLLEGQAQTQKPCSNFNFQCWCFIPWGSSFSTPDWTFMREAMCKLNIQYNQKAFFFFSFFFS